MNDDHYMKFAGDPGATGAPLGPLSDLSALFEKMPPTPEQVEELRAASMRVVNNALDDEEGFAIIGEELFYPVRTIVEYESLARKVLKSRPLKQGEANKFCGIGTWVFYMEHAGPESMAVRSTKGDCTPAEFIITMSPTLRLADKGPSVWDAVEREQDLARQHWQYEEDKNLVLLLDRAAAQLPQVIETPRLTVKALRSAFEVLDKSVQSVTGTTLKQGQSFVSKVIVNRADLADLLLDPDDLFGAKEFQHTIERTKMLAGYVGKLGDVDIMVGAGTGIVEAVQPGTAYVLCEPALLGEITKRFDFSEPWKKDDVRGWVWVSQESMCLAPYGVVKLVIG